LGGGGNSISDGTSNVTVTSTNGNVVIGVNNDAASWTFATDGNIYAKSFNDLVFVADDPQGDGVSIKQVITDGATELARTSLEDGQFSIYPSGGTGEEWRFSGTTLQVTNNSKVRAFGSNIVVETMYDGSGGGSASLRSVSNANDPNIYSTFDATTTGANIKVYNGGSDSGVEHAWQFDVNGNLTLPVGGDILDSTGTSVLFSGDYTDLSNQPTILAEPAFTIKTTDFNATAGSRYGYNTTAGVVTATLPASPSAGDAIYFADASGTTSTNNFIIARNSQTIMGSASDMTTNTNDQSFGLFYNGTTWRVY
jgi:hypothetical protein